MKRTVERSEPTRFGAYLVRRLSEMRLTNAAFASRVGVSAMTVSSWCNGPDMPASGKWASLAKALGTDYATIASLVLGREIRVVEDCPSSDTSHRPEVQELARLWADLPEERREELLCIMEGWAGKEKVPQLSLFRSETGA